MGRKIMGVLTGIVILAFVVVMAVGGLSKSGGADEESPATTTSTTRPRSSTTTTAPTTVAPATTVASAEEVLADAMADLERELTIRREDLVHPEVRAVAECKSDPFLYNSLAEVKRGDRTKRQDTDSVTIPFQADKAEDMVAELRVEDCQNIVVLDMVIRAFNEANFVVNGKTLTQLNPWMAEWMALAGTDLEKFVNVDELLLVKEEGGERKLYVRPEVQEYAMLANALLSKAQLVGIVPDLLTSENWHLKGVTEGAIPRVALNERQYTGTFLVFEFTAKGFGCVQRFGFNAGTPDNPFGDKRFARFACPPPPAPEPPAPEPTPTTGPRPRPRPTPTTSTVPPAPTTVPPTTAPPSTVPPMHPPADGPPPVATQPPHRPPATTSTTVHVPPTGPAPIEGTPAPPPLPGGYDRGSPDGSGTPGGSTTRPDGSTVGGGPTPAAPGPTPVVDNDTHTGMPAPPP